MIYLDLAIYALALYGVYNLMVKFKLWDPFLSFMKGFISEFKKAGKKDD